MKNNLPKITIHGPIRDLLRFVKHMSDRKRIFRRSSALRPEEYNGLSLKSALHPEFQLLRISEIIHENDKSNTYRMTPVTNEKEFQSIAPFQAGQYLSVEIELDSGFVISRPFSISNSPDDARKNNSYEITIKTDNDAFIPEVIFKTWETGKIVKVSDPCGEFSYNPLRDSSNLVCIAGGSGVTPFRSIISDILNNHKDVSVVLIQGTASMESLLFKDEFQSLEKANPDKFKWIPVLSDEPEKTEKIENNTPEMRRGFINAGILAEAFGDNKSTAFICGPQGMHQFVDNQIQLAEISTGRIRREDYGIPGRPSGNGVVLLQVNIADTTLKIQADRDETVLVALERAGLEPPSRCRTGSCGWCRGLLLEGDIRYENEPEGLRLADRKAGYFHPCAAKPETDLIIDIPAKPQNEHAS